MPSPMYCKRGDRMNIFAEAADILSRATCSDKYAPVVRILLDIAKSDHELSKLDNPPDSSPWSVCDRETYNEPRGCSKPCPACGTTLSLTGKDNSQSFWQCFNCGHKEGEL